MCLGEFCKTADENVPILCPECLAEQFHTLTEEDLYDMYLFFIEAPDISEPIKELFFTAFNKLLLVKREFNKPIKGE